MGETYQEGSVQALTSTSAVLSDLFEEAGENLDQMEQMLLNWT